MSGRANHGRIRHSQARGSNARANRCRSAPGTPAFPAPSEAFPWGHSHEPRRSQIYHERIAYYLDIENIIDYSDPPVSLTMPQTMPLLPVSTGSFYGFLFSVPGQLEGLGQMQGGVVQRQTMDRRPEIQHVPLDPAIRVEALKGVLAQMDREGSLRVPGVAVHGAGTTALLAAAAQLRQETQMLQAPVPWSPVDARMRSPPWAAWLRRGGVAGLTGGAAGSTVEVAVVTTSSRGQVPFVAHGFLVGSGCCTGAGIAGSRR